MNRNDLIFAMAEQSGLSKTDSEKALNATLDAISGAMTNGEKVSLIGFGTFSVANRAARDGRNPRTGATIKIAAKNVVKFKAGSTLADSVN